MNPDFIDRYGLILPRRSPTWKPADNGVLFISVAVLLGFEWPKYIAQVRSCYLKKGLIGRWPGNNYDQCAWDDYLGVAAACIKLKETKIPREILLYGFTHWGIFNTDGKLEGKDWLGRSVQVWALMIVAAFPCMKYPMLPWLYIVTLFFRKPDLNDTSGFQLQWVYLSAMNILGFKLQAYEDHMLLLPKAFAIYYEHDHPFNTEELK